MTINRYRCLGCGLVFHTDLLLNEPEVLELRACPCCLGVGCLEAEGEAVSLCAGCSDAMPADPPGDWPEGAEARVC